MSRKRKPNSGDPRKDQVDAAARDAARQTQAGGPQRQRLDMSRSRILDQQDAPPGAAELIARWRKAVSTTRLDPCEHVERAWGSGSAITLHWALWRPDRAACEKCFTSWLVPDTAGHATTEFCDLCGAERPTDYLQLAAGPFVIHGDLCDECQARPGTP